MTPLAVLSPWNFLAIGCGAALGAWLRWGLGLILNPLFTPFPLGTLAANLLGGYLIGVAVGLFHLHADWPLVWKLAVITGFLGGLTTFSTFSLEIFSQLQSGNYFWAFTSLLVHVTGSILMTALGFFVVTWLL